MGVAHAKRAETGEAMLQVNDALDGVLLGCFFFGLVFTVLLFFVGDAGIFAESGAEGEGEGLARVNLSVLLAFVAWFGGVGYLARNAADWGVPLTVLVAVGGGLLGAIAVARVSAALVTPKGAVLDPADYRLPGTIARVTSSIRANGVGEVVYEQAGVRQVAAARAAGGQAIGRGAEVVVLETKGGIALVQPSEVFFGDADAAPAVRTRGARPGPIHPDSR